MFSVEGFSIEQYMAGAPLPVITNTSASRPNNYIFGLLKTKSNLVGTFVCKKGAKVPSNAFCINEFTGTFSEVKDKLNLLFLEEQKPKFDSEFEFCPGRVVCHFDGGRKHRGILLTKCSTKHWFLLFFTSNPFWGKVARKATKEELAISGFVYDKPTYLASAIRPEHELTTKEYILPEHWIARLVKEFFISQKGK